MPDDVGGMAGQLDDALAKTIVAGFTLRHARISVAAANEFDPRLVGVFPANRPVAPPDGDSDEASAP